jgi:hypothetical protein
MIPSIHVKDPNARFIAASRTAVPELIAEVRRLREGLREACDMATDYMALPDERWARLRELEKLAEGDG